MSTRNKIRLRKERVEIISLMKTTSYYKKQLIGFEKKLSRAYEENRIDKEKYLRRLNEGLQGRTLRQWLRYYDQCINVYNTRVVEIDRELRELEKSRNLLPILTIFAFVALLGLSYYFIQPAITGFTLIENGTNATESVFRIQLVNINISEETGIIETTEIENDRLIQVKAEINKPVEWKLITRNKTIELPLEASNIEVNKLINETEDIKEKARLKNQFGANNLNNKKLIEVDELNETKLEVTYYTKAPYSIESNLTQNKDLISKDITIKSDSELHYQNVLSYTEIPESKTDQINLYNYINNEKIEVTNNQLYNVSYLDLNNNGLIDKLVWYVPQLSEQNFSVEISLTILTLQSYPVVNSNWTVLFNTTGTADLKIRASNGTSWSDDLNSTGTDLTFLELKCGTAIQNYQWLNNSVLISNYQCNETSQEISKVLTTGVHTIEFTFGNITKYAYNLASVTNGTAGDINNSNAVFFNTTFNSSGFVQLNGSGSSGYPNFSLFGNYTSKIFNANASAKWSNFSWGELVPFGQELPGNGFNSIIETSSASRGFNMTGNVLLMHFDNITNFENATNGSKFNVYDWSLNRNNGTGIANASNGGPQFDVTGGKFGGAFEFDGKDDFINLTNITLNSFTATAWIKHKTDPASSSIIDNEVCGVVDDWGLQLADNDSVRLQIGNSGVSDKLITSISIVPDNLWTHIVATRDTGTGLVKIYINGRFDNEATSPHNRSVGGAAPSCDIFGNQIGIGHNERVATLKFPSFNGTIDEATIWNRSLSDLEIQDLYKRGHSNLTAQVRSCDDSSCSGETFRGPDNTSDSYFTNATFNTLNTSIAGNNQYFQFKFLFERDINNYKFLL